MIPMMDRIGIEHQEGWRDWVKQIPSLKFDPEWMVKIIPPFGGAMARFLINLNHARVSVYLDCNDNLGCVGSPYWEVYPVDGDVARFLIHETDDLMACIERSLAEQPAPPPAAGD